MPDFSCSGTRIVPTDASFSTGRKFSPIRAVHGTCRFNAELQDPAVNPCDEPDESKPNDPII